MKDIRWKQGCYDHHVILIILQAQLTHMTAFIGTLCHARDTYYLCGWSSSLTVLQSAGEGYAALCQTRVGAFRACHQAKAPLRALLCVVEVRGIKTSTNIYSAKQRARPSQWRRKRTWAVCLSMSVSPQTVSMRDYDACFVNLQSWSELFSAPPNSRQCHDPVESMQPVASVGEPTLCMNISTQVLSL